jgi:hypothetical protein
MDKPLSEVFAEAAQAWVEAEAAAQILDDTKTLIMAQKQTALGDLPVNRAEQQIKASADWYEHIEKIVEARKVANYAKMDLEIIRMRFNEQSSREANARLELKMAP